MEYKDYYYNEWKRFEKEGQYNYAGACKEMYEGLVKDSLKKPYLKRYYQLRAFPPINLN